MNLHAEQRQRRELVPVAILTIIVVYAIALCIGWPQSGTRLILEHQHQAAETTAAAEVANITAPPFWTVLPFVLLLAGIALLPLIPHTSHWWESNFNRFKVAGGLALLTMVYYAFLHSGGL